MIVALAALTASLGMEGRGLAVLTDTLGRHRMPIYLLSVSGLAALVFLALPITTFLTSPGELDIHLNYLMDISLRDMMIVIYVATALYVLAFTSRMRTILSVLALGAFSLSITYAFILPLGYPVMTGLTFEQLPISWAARFLRVMIDACVIVAITLGLRAIFVRYGARVITVGVVLINISLGSASALALRSEQIGMAGGSSESPESTSSPLRFSPTNPNVLILFLDRFMGSYVESILETDPRLATELSGFVWYPKTVSAGENSIAGVHPMLGGYDYTPVEMNARKKNLRSLSVEAYSILPWNFSKNGYRVNVVNPRGLGFTMAGDCKYLQIENVHCAHIPAAVSAKKAQEAGFPLIELSKSNYADLLVLLASMRATPYALKEVLRVKGPWRPFMDHSAGTTFREWAELQALPDLSLTNARESNFNFVSNILPHEPYYMGEDCQPQPQRFFATQDEVRRLGHESLFSLQHAITARCALLIVVDYLNFLKTKGVYDNTQIVIVSDHGIVGRVRDASKRAVAGGTQSNIFVRSRSVLLVKNVGAEGDLQVSEEFKPNAEAPIMACEQIGGCINPWLDNRPIETAGRDDPFHVSLVPWQFSQQKPDAFVIAAQFTLRGKDPFDANGWDVPAFLILP